MSSIPSVPQPLHPYFHPSPSASEPSPTKAYIMALSLQPHPEGGYFCETDRDPLKVPNPFPSDPTLNYSSPSVTAPPPGDDKTRNASTTIYYYLTLKSPTGVIHRNKGRTVHTLHRGRGRYVIIHADEVIKDGIVQEGKKARVESFVVGQDVAKGERLQWVVEGGKFKASFLLPDVDGGEGSDGLLISEVYWCILSPSFRTTRRE